MGSLVATDGEWRNDFVFGRKAKEREERELWATPREACVKVAETLSFIRFKRLL